MTPRRRVYLSTTAVPQPSERQIQRTILQLVALRAPAGTFTFHVGNGGYRKPVEAAIFKADGVVSGVPDLCIISSGRAFFLELKRPGGKLSDNQKACHERLRQAGAVVMTAAGVDEAVEALQNTGILPGDRP
jgi:VRR-NUC domain